MKTSAYIKLIFFILFLLPKSASSQKQTVGLLNYNPDKIADGYTLFYPRKQPNVYLINNCGEIVHQWSDDPMFVPNNAVYVLENGNLVKCKKTPANGLIGKGGGGYFIDILSWENELLWSYELNTETERLHHDVEVLPNGNILMIAWEQKSAEDAISNGRLSSTIRGNVIYPDYIFEIDPNTNEKVWEWHVWDHLIQDVDSTKANYGIVSDHPELVDINYLLNEGPLDWDWLHINAIDYNAELDQIMLCVPYFNEMWIIDHSTSTEEAAGHQGGIYDQGGDLLYRVGNPASYKRGTPEDNILTFPHDTHWANDFLPNNHSQYGNMVIFNNNGDSTFSEMIIFESPWDDVNSEYKKEDGVFLPKVFDIAITHPEPNSFFSKGLSSVQILPNGNVLGCSGMQGYFIELSPEGELVWEYKVPMRNGSPVSQGSNLVTHDNLTFRAFKYPEDYIAFEGKDLSPKSFLELNPYLDYCERLVNTADIELYNFLVSPNPASNFINITCEENGFFNIKLIDLLGHEHISKFEFGNSFQIDISGIDSGIYILILNEDEKHMLLIH